MGVRAEKLAATNAGRSMAAFFSQIGYKPTEEWKEEIVIFDRRQGGVAVRPPSGPSAFFQTARPPSLSPDQDPREVFADWLIAPKNPWFARNIVNRIWCWLLGRGIIHEPDDVRPDNPPSNPELLAFLERGTGRLALRPETDFPLDFELENVPAFLDSRRPIIPRPRPIFRIYPLRRLEAEVLIDALCQITGTTEKYSSPIPEPFTFIPDDQRSIALADGSITSSFLEMFGRPPRDTGLESERNNRPTAAQSLHLLNSSHIQRKIEQSPSSRAIMQSKNKPREILEELYLTILSRYPTDEELKIVRDYAQSGTGRRDWRWTLLGLWSTARSSFTGINQNNEQPTKFRGSNRPVSIVRAFYQARGARSSPVGRLCAAGF